MLDYLYSLRYDYIASNETLVRRKTKMKPKKQIVDIETVKREGITTNSITFMGTTRNKEMTAMFDAEKFYKSIIKRCV